MDKLYKAGKFKQFGLSNFTAFEVAEVAMICKYNNWVRPTIYQAIYSCIQRSIEDELIPACHRYGLDVVIYSPIAGGLLSGKVASKDAIPTEGRFSNQVMNGLARNRYWRDSTFDALHELRQAAEKHSLTMVEVALRWMVHHSKLDLKDGNDGIIIGTTSLKHLASNLDDLEKGPLPDDVVEAIDRVWVIAKPDAANYWHLDLKYTYNTMQALFGPGAK